MRDCKFFTLLQIIRRVGGSLVVLVVLAALSGASSRASDVDGVRFRQADAAGTLLVKRCTPRPITMPSGPVAAAGLPWDAHLPDDSAQPGFYLDWRKFFPVIGLFLLWLWTLRRVDLDAAALRIPRERWNEILFASGLCGLLTALSLPTYFFGYVLLILSYAVPVSLYVTVRNRHVPAERRLFTRDHLLGLPREFVKIVAAILTGAGTRTAGADVVFYGKSVTGGDDESLVQHAQTSRGYRAARELVYDAVSRRATDIHLEPTDKKIAVRIRIDGVLCSADPFERQAGHAVMNIFKVLAALDIADRRRSQDGSFRAEVGGRRLDVRVATQPTQHGEKVSLRILDPSHSLSNLSALGLRKALQERVRGCLNRSHGLLLVCGPTGAGKTTTLYAALRELNTREKNVITVEDPIEYKMANVNQIEINSKAGQTFAGALRNLLRQDPDVLMVGEIRDEETARIACQAANTGHLVLTTIHANDTITALFRLLDLGVEPYLASNSITAILGQRLTRRLCPDCKESYTPADDELNELGLPPEKVTELYRPPKPGKANCKVCGGSGHLGRIGIFEYLEITPPIREMIREKAAADRILGEARSNGLLMLGEEGLGLVARGIISAEELNRAVGEGA